MWLVPRHSPGRTNRTEVPPVVKAALVRWYTGVGSDADHRASIAVIVKARTHHQWIACDCLNGEGAPPLMSPSFLSEAETYYLRRLTSQLQRRPEHHTDCPFYRPQAPQRLREKASAAPREIGAPDGYFSAHRLAPETLAQMPDDADCDDRSRGVAIPKLARLLWQLMDLGQLNVMDPLPPDRGSPHSLSDEFRKLRKASEQFEVAPGIPLARHFYTHIDPFEREQVFARLRKEGRNWPAGYAPQAFLALYAVDISGTRIRLAQDRELELQTRVQHIGVHNHGIGGPYVVLVLVGEVNPREGYQALRGYAQPIHSPNLFMPVQSATERRTVDALARLQFRLRRRMIALTARKPLFDPISRIGPLRPDFLVNLLDRRTGELIEMALTVSSFTDPDHLAMKAQQHHQLAELGEAIAFDDEGLRAGALDRAIAKRLDLKL